MENNIKISKNAIFSTCVYLCIPNRNLNSSFTYKCGELIPVWHNQGHDVGEGSLAVDADVFNERTSLQLGLDLAQRDVLAELQLDQILLTIDDFQRSCVWKEK